VGWENRKCDNRKNYVLCNILINRSENGGQLLDQMRSVSSLFQLLDHRDNDVIADPLRIDLGSDTVGRGRRWRVLVGTAPRATLLSQRLFVAMSSCFCVRRLRLPLVRPLYFLDGGS
jgi:hypothetical protein